MVTVYDIFGLLGVAIAVANYAHLQWRRDYVREIGYSAGNVLSCALMLVSLSYNWNLSAFVTNVIMGLISLYGIYRCLKYSYRAKMLEKSEKTGL